ncbi:hypothetical protein PR048_005861 [Dryococelus australis]|uniref:Uncharacterized protein n=1 Tax=Dryococelus australis TaxID=614101 RepID=A0ABQ9I9D1_9NEOP|nr:hypothetical protein PR048_005861 [Dryococelus australis]
MHNSDTVDESTGEMCKPDVITYYNLTKGGVDVVDEMKASYSVSRTSVNNSNSFVCVRPTFTPFLLVVDAEVQYSKRSWDPPANSLDEVVAAGGLEQFETPRYISRKVHNETSGFQALSRRSLFNPQIIKCGFKALSQVLPIGLDQSTDPLPQPQSCTYHTPAHTSITHIVAPLPLHIHLQPTTRLSTPLPIFHYRNPNWFLKRLTLSKTVSCQDQLLQILLKPWTSPKAHATHLYQQSMTTNIEKVCKRLPSDHHSWVTLGDVTAEPGRRTGTPQRHYCSPRNVSWVRTRPALRTSSSRMARAPVAGGRHASLAPRHTLLKNTEFRNFQAGEKSSGAAGKTLADWPVTLPVNRGRIRHCETVFRIWPLPLKCCGKRREDHLRVGEVLVSFTRREFSLACNLQIVHKYADARDIRLASLLVNCNSLPTSGITVAERLACSPPTKAIPVQSPAGSLPILACGNHAERCRWSAGFLGDIPFPLHFIPNDYDESGLLASGIGDRSSSCSFIPIRRWPSFALSWINVILTLTVILDSGDI